MVSANTEGGSSGDGTTERTEREAGGEECEEEEAAHTTEVEFMRTAGEVAPTEDAGSYESEGCSEER